VRNTRRAGLRRERGNRRERAADPSKILGNYSHEELEPRNGFAMTIPIGMANDYNGYIATYREFRRGDHYRKALTAWGPHSSDYLGHAAGRAQRAPQAAGWGCPADGGQAP
jgi:hypothetical protein